MAWSRLSIQPAPIQHSTSVWLLFPDPRERFSLWKIILCTVEYYVQYINICVTPHQNPFIAAILVSALMQTWHLLVVVVGYQLKKYRCQKNIAIRKNCRKKSGFLFKWSLTKLTFYWSTVRKESLSMCDP